MKAKEPRYDVGVVVGRFQVDELHGPHRELLEFAQERHGKVIVFVGNSAVRCTRDNPLPFIMRQRMVQSAFPDFTVLYIDDRRSDEHWSKKLDSEVKKIITPSQTAVLYGGRESCLDRYSGKLPTIELEQAQEAWLSGTARRREIASKDAINDPMMRRGIIWAAHGDWPRLTLAVDLAVFNEDFTKILLVRKRFETEFRLVGEHVELKSPSLEANARRGAMEEANVSITDPVYITSMPVDDWRYRGETAAGMFTALFGAKFMSGQPRANDTDEIDEVAWFPVDVPLTKIVPEHHPLLKAAQAWAATQDNR